MKKIICIPFFLALLILVASCKGSLTPENPATPENSGDSQNQNNEEDQNQNTSIIDKFFWGTWVRMDSGAVYVMDENQITVYKKDSDQVSNVYDAVSSTESELSVSGIGKFTKQSDSVIQNNAIPFFRKGGSNLSYSLKLVGFEDTVSRAASSLTPGSIKVKASSKKYKSFQKEAEPTEDGAINLTAPVSGDEQTVTVSTSDTVLVVPGIKIENDGSDMGTIPVTNPGEYSLKVTGVIDDEEKDDGYLYGNYFKTYSMILTITNISQVTSETSACEIQGKDPQLKITDENGGSLNAITISTLKPGLTKEIKLKVSYGNIDSGYVDTGINVDIKNMKTGRTWKDYVPLRFFRGLLPITVTAKSTENNANAALNGFVIYPDYNSQFFDIPHNSSRILYVPDFGKDKSYTLSFSGATVEGELSNSTEMFYLVNPGTNTEDDFVIPTTSDAISTCYNFGEPNDTEFDAEEVSDKFMAYLNEGDIDFFDVKVEYDKFISPEKNVMYKVKFEDQYNQDNSYIKVFNSGEKLASTYSRRSSVLPKGYNSFLGWYLNGSKISQDYVVKSNITLEAKYNPEQYTITFKLMNNSAYYDTTSSSYTVEDKLTLFTPSRSGYSFEGWYESSNYSDQIVTVIPKGSTGNKTFYAKWSENTYNITYELNGGSNDDFNKTTYTVNDSFSLISPVKNGYIFQGWYEKSDFSGSKTTSISSGSTGDLTLYAKWSPVKYTITYYLNDGTNSSDNPDYYTIEESVNFVSPSRYGYAFLGWYEKSDFSSNKITSISLGTTGNTTLYAKWGLGDYSITYELNGGTNAQSNPESYSVNDSITLTSPIRTGYTFAGWYTKSDFSGNKITAISSGSTGNLTFYAKWTPTNYNITYYLNGGTNSSNNPTYYTIEQSIILEAPSRNGYLFLGWYTTVDFSEDRITSIPLGSCEAKSLYAKWDLTDYSITYELNGGTNAQGNSENYTVNDSITLASPTRIGYTFAGWYTKSDFTGDAITSISTGSTGNLTLYAKWTPKNYNITYYLNGGTNSSNNPSYYTIEQSINLEDPSLNGYVFLGWYDLTGNRITQIPTGTTGLKYLEAKWGVALSISVYGSDLSDISVTQTQSSENITFTASQGYNSYTWEVDGIMQSSVGKTFVFNTKDLSPGIYEIYLEAKSGTIIRSSLLYVKVEAE